MISNRTFARGAMLAALAAWSLALGACSTSSSTPSTTVSGAQVRVVHASPDAGAVDVYVYAQGKTRPAKPTVSAAAYPQITNFLSLSPGSYTIDVIAPAGSASSTTPVATEIVTVLAKTNYSIAVAGEVANKTLQFLNFVEPALTAGTSALVVHHAAPLVQTLLGGPVAVGTWDASQPIPTSITTLFTFSLQPGTSGPAASGSVNGGEYFLTPLPSSLPAQVAFAAGAPAGSSFAPIVTSTLSQLASGLQFPTDGQKTLAAATTLPTTSYHLSIFAIDNATTNAQLIGTDDP